MRFGQVTGVISFDTADLKLSGGSNLVVNSAGGAISANKIEGTTSEDVTLNATGGTVAVEAIGTLVNSSNAFVPTRAGGVTLNGNITTDANTGDSVTVTGP